MTAYDEYVTPILVGTNREKYEWAIGSALAGGPEKCLVLCGTAMTGKSELMTIAKRIFARPEMPAVIIQEGMRYSTLETGYVFAACLQDYESTNLRHVITKTSGYRHSDEIYYPLYEAMREETDLIANACVERYLALGPIAYENLTVNNLPIEESV